VSAAYKSPLFKFAEVAADGDLANPKIARKITGRGMPVLLNDLENPLNAFFLDQPGHMTWICPLSEWW
jgi:hypothetical protein